MELAAYTRQLVERCHCGGWIRIFNSTLQYLKYWYKPDIDESLNTLNIHLIPSISEILIQTWHHCIPTLLVRFMPKLAYLINLSYYFLRWHVQQLQTTQTNKEHIQMHWLCWNWFEQTQLRPIFWRLVNGIQWYHICDNISDIATVTIVFNDYAW